MMLDLASGRDEGRVPHSLEQDLPCHDGPDQCDRGSFPFNGFTPALAFGILAIACLALSVFGREGG
tara:strand:- start:2115 stop:2312 length:198 start_codon:yes stop_codon:yes gene_type:complete